MKTITLLFCSLAIAGAVQAQIIHIPADYPTIQQGISAAIPGDTVLVSDGNYYEQINFLGKKPLIVASEFLMDGDTSHISNTIIDGSQLTNMDSASVIYFVSGEDTTSIIYGFTIRGGKGTIAANTVIDRMGGGIFISGAGAKIIHNRITRNTLDGTQPANGETVFGVGIATDTAGFASNWVVIENNIIDKNSAVSESSAGAGGIYIITNSRIINNRISDNTCIGSGAQAGGAALRFL
ncbi:MAG: DUF1565 domain-containing protein [Bacteroidetes bacterium]|nr:DUF1565 domain-containing protein [Bacteroidota bacterium]